MLVADLVVGVAVATPPAATAAAREELGGKLRVQTSLWPVRKE